MILVDPRAGSSELVTPLLAAGLPVEKAHLDFGDIAFMGRGVGGADTYVGLEHKKLPDLVSSLSSRLPGHQLPGMLTTYDRCYLVVEGEWEADAKGNVVVPSKAMRGRKSPLKGAPSAVELIKRVLTLEHRGGLRTYWSPNQAATVRWVMALYRWWSDRDLDSHKTHIAIHSPDLDASLLLPISFERQIAALLPGVGVKKSRDVAKHFKSVAAMVTAPESEWVKIDGIGKTLAAKIVAACRGKGERH